MSSQKFRLPAAGLAHLSSEPQKAQAPEKVINPGLEHRPFSEDEIKQAFETFDLDNNRFVGAMEIKHILDIIGEEATDEEIDEMIRMCDNDGDGQVTFDEFQKMMTQPPAPLPPPLPPFKRQRQRKRAIQGPGQEPGGPEVKGKRAMAEAAGALQKVRAESIEALVRRLAGGTARIKPSQIKRIYKRFQDIDVDHSGAVDYEEFCMALEMQDGHISRQMFKVFDMDDSGSIELKEFIVVLSRYTEASKAEKLKFAFMMFDEDGSGAIDRNELIEMMASSFVVEGYSREELEEKADQVFEILGVSQEQGIEYQDFLKLANDKRALIYPIEEKKLITQGVSMQGGSS